MLFTAASHGLPAIHGFLVFPLVRVRVRVRLELARPLAMGPSAIAALNYGGHESRIPVM